MKDRKTYDTKAQMTIYLSLILTILISCTLTVLEAARGNAIKTQSELIVEMSLDSVFSEYQRELWNRYGLFFIDTSYGTGKGSFCNTEDRMKEYLDYNAEPTKDVFAVLDRDFLKLGCEDVQVEGLRLATDEAGMVFMKQAVVSVKQEYGIEYLLRWQNLFECCEKQKLREIDLEEELNRQKIMCNETVGSGTIADKIWNHDVITHTENTMKEVKWKGILPLVKEEGKTLSERQVDLEQYISHRIKNEGTGFQEGWSPGLTDEVLFGEFILSCMGDYSNEKKESVLKYQTEYVIAGKENDTSNLRSTVTAIFFLREGANFVAIQSDEEKTAITDLIGESVCTLIGVPEAGVYLSQALKIMWAFCEAVCDTKNLLGGGRVPLLKQPGQWTLGFDELLTPDERNPANIDNTEAALSYQDYLRLFLLTIPTENKVFRVMDLIEMDIRNSSQNKAFRMDECTDCIQVAVRISGGYGYQYLIKKKHGYYE